MDAATKARLDNLQKQLEDRGVVDVKFHVDRSNGPVDGQKLAEDTATVLEAMLEGRVSPALPIGDSNIHDPEYRAQMESLWESGKYE